MLSLTTKRVAMKPSPRATKVMIRKLASENQRNKLNCIEVAVTSLPLKYFPRLKVWLMALSC
ncbi:hypothetical protein D3C81_2304590 [compost metagenome]